jgi:glutamate synthase domain-containing protein 1
LKLLSQSKFEYIGWRDVPVDVSTWTNPPKEPIIKQVFIGKNG